MKWNNEFLQKKGFVYNLHGFLDQNGSHYKIMSLYTEFEFIVIKIKM